MTLAIRSGSGTILLRGHGVPEPCWQKARHSTLVRVLMAGDIGGFSSILLSEAVLCANCDMISNSGNYCRCCGSSAVMSLSQLLGGCIRHERGATLIEWPNATDIALRSRQHAAAEESTESAA